MIPLPPGLLAQLKRRRLQPRWAAADVGLGERRSDARGSGMEFADHRPYQPGDDLRHLDRHAYARFREPIVKRFAAERGLDVSLLLDRSASMDFGDPTKEACAIRIGVAIACVALAGGDRLRVGSFGGGAAVEWHPPLSGIGRLPEVADRLRGGVAPGPTALPAVASRAVERLEGHGLLVVVSDWWTDDPVHAVQTFSKSGQELVAVHVLSPDEENPSWDDGEIQLEDAESGELFEVVLDAAARDRYAREIDAWRGQLKSAVEGVVGRYLPVRCDAALHEVLLHDWRSAGFFR